MYMYIAAFIHTISIRPNLQGERYLFSLVSNSRITTTAKITQDNKGGDELCFFRPVDHATLLVNRRSRDGDMQMPDNFGSRRR